MQEHASAGSTYSTCVEEVPGLLHETCLKMYMLTPCWSADSHAEMLECCHGGMLELPRCCHAGMECWNAGTLKCWVAGLLKCMLSETHEATKRNDDMHADIIVTCFLHYHATGNWNAAAKTVEF